MIINITLLAAFILFVFLAGLFAGAETGIYQLSRLRLRLGIEHKKISFVILGKAMRDGAGLLISLLLATNLTYYLATSSITYLVLSNKPNSAGVELIVTITATPIFFVFSELIPKNLFYYRADDIMPAISPLIYAFDRLARLTGVIYILKFANNLTSGFKRSAEIKKSSALTTTMGLEAILHETKEEGILSTTQSEMARRLGHISHLTIASTMIQLNRAIALNIKSSKDDLMNICRKHRFTRYPVYDGWHSNIIGYVNIYQCVSSDKDYTELYDFLKPLQKMTSDTVVIDAIESMQAKKDEMILVTQKKHNKPVGIVTMKDLAEELLGELAEW